MLESLAGKAALVTGGSRRLGAAIVRTLAGAGMSVALHYRSSRSEAQALADEVAKAGGRVLLLPGDLAGCGVAAALVEDAARVLGRLDLLVNNASAFYPTPIGTVGERQWDELMAVNVKAPFFAAQEAARRLGEGGSIVNVADASVWTPWPHHVPYQVSKAALAAMTGYLARALAPAVRVNAVCPGPILMAEGARDDEQARAVARVPLGRLGEPEDIARAVAYLAASPYLTGVLLPVDGGRRLG